MRKPISDHYDVVISGMGPAGLSAAYEAATLGKKVLIVTDREADFKRVQKVFLDQSNKAYLISMLQTEINLNLTSEEKTADRKFIRELSELTVGLKDIEKFLYRRLKKFDLIDFMFHCKIDSINLKNGHLSIHPAKSNVRFTHLIGADGAKHHTVNVFNEYCAVSNPTLAIRHHLDEWGTKNGEKKAPHVYHVGAYLVIKRKNGDEIGFPSKKSAYILSNNYLCQMVFDWQGYVKNEKKQIKCNFTGETPEFEDGTLSREAALSYIRRIVIEVLKQNGLSNDDIENIEINFPDNSKKHGSGKDHLKFSLFKREILHANKAAVELDQHYFLIAGDAYRSPDYQVGHGANDALSHAQSIGDVLAGRIEIDDYDALCDENAYIAHRGTAAFLEDKLGTAQKIQETLSRAERATTPGIQLFQDRETLPNPYASSENLQANEKKPKK